MKKKDFLIIPLLSIYIGLVLALGFSLSQSKALAKDFRLIEDLITEADRTQKIIVVEFYSDFCGYCKELDPRLTKIIKSFHHDFTLVKINGEKAKYAKLMQDFKVDGYPALFFINPYIKKIRMVERVSYESSKLLSKEFISELEAQ